MIESHSHLSREYQIAADEVFARRLQQEEEEKRKSPKTTKQHWTEKKIRTFWSQ